MVAILLSPPQARAAYGKFTRCLHIICPRRCLPYAPPGLRNVPFPVNLKQNKTKKARRPFFSIPRLHAWWVAKSWVVWGSPVTNLRTHMHMPIRVQHGGTHFVQLIGSEPVETDSNWHWAGLLGSAALVLLQMSERGFGGNHRCETDFWFPLLFCYQDLVGKQVGAQLRYQHEKIMGRAGGVEASTAELTSEKSCTCWT